MSPQVPKAATKTHSPKVGFVSLGCPKALVDSERILSQLRAEGYETAADYAGADVVVVNTCGFLDSARTESLEAIGEALAENGRVIVTGCLGAEANVIRDAHPNVLAPGKRTLHTLLPGMLFRDGRPWIVTGSMGGDAQPQIYAQVVSDFVDR